MMADTRIMSLILFSWLTVVSGYAAGQKSSDATTAGTHWVPVNETDWAVYMDAPAYHFKIAKKYLQDGDKVHAAAELSRGVTFLNFQKDRLVAASREIERLSKRITAGGLTDTSDFNVVVNHALHAIDHRYRMVPVDIGGSTMFGEAHEYHFKKAKKNLEKQDRTVTADEIRQAAAFLKLKAASMGITPWSTVDSAEAALQKLAGNVESGSVKNVAELDKVFTEATSIFRKKKE
jgi:hypothetical protein